MGDQVVPVLCLLQTGESHLGSGDVLIVLVCLTSTSRGWAIARSRRKDMGGRCDRLRKRAICPAGQGSTLLGLRMRRCRWQNERDVDVSGSGRVNDQIESGSETHLLWVLEVFEKCVVVLSSRSAIQLPKLESKLLIERRETYPSNTLVDVGGGV